METILIVDDEKHYRVILSEVLQEEGYASFLSVIQAPAIIYAVSFDSPMLYRVKNDGL